MENEYGLYVGIDWATEAHQVCVLDPQRRVLEERKVDHSGGALLELLDWLTRLCESQPERVAVSIEIPRGAIVESLVERGFHVYSINPKQLDRFRDRHTVPGAKDDRRDAFVLADSLRTDRPCFRRVRIDDPLVIQIRELSRIDEDLCEEETRLANRLRDQLHRYFPQMLRLSPAADESWLWSLLELAPTPAHVGRLRRERVAKLLREKRIRRLDADQVLAELRALPLHVAPGTTEAASAHIAVLLPRLRLVHEQRADCTRRLHILLDAIATVEPPEGKKREHHDVEILRSLPGVGVRVAAAMLAEASQALADRDYHSLRALSGAAPITRQSGKSRVVIMRRGCNARLRNALYHWARTGTQLDERWRALYAALRARGHTHGRALRSVADRQLKVLVAMLRSGTLYDSNRRRVQPVAPLETAA